MMTVYFVETRAAEQLIDQLLWTFSQSSFIPHLICAQTGEIPPEPVLIITAQIRIEGYEAVTCECPAGIEFIRQV
jgi:DNA polymerase IIIc chi subunit